MIKRNEVSGIFGVLCMVLMMVLPPQSSYGATTTTSTLPVTAMILAGTCDVLLGTSDSGGTLSTTDKTVSIGYIAQAGSLVKGGVTAGANNVRLALNCKGVSAVGKKPVITVNGTALGGSGPGAWIFKGTTNTIDTHVGIVMIDKAVTSYVTTEGQMTHWDTSAYIKPGSKVELSGGTNYRDFKMGMSCGDETSCPPPSQGLTNPEGRIEAAMTFTFNYE